MDAIATSFDARLCFGVTRRTPHRTLKGVRHFFRGRFRRCHSTISARVGNPRRIVVDGSELILIIGGGGGGGAGAASSSRSFNHDKRRRID